MDADHQDLLKGQAEAWKLMCAFADSMVLKSAVELRLADIIHSHGRPITLSEMASGIDSASPNIPYLERIMRMLVRKRIFAAHPPPADGVVEEAMYGMTPVSKWLLHDSELTLAPMILGLTNPWLMEPWSYFSQCVKEGGIPFKMANGSEIWDFASQNPGFNYLFNAAMACTAKIAVKALLSQYKHGFDNIRSLVDVGGGTGTTIAEIVKSHPHIRGINFDLPHVVATAPARDGVSHLGGDMFNAIPSADTVFMKWILHDWDDDNCVKILKECRKAIPEETGKLVLIETVVQEDGNGIFGDMGLVCDLTMFANTSGGRERTELEWKKLLEAGGFPRYKIIPMPALNSIIEAYPL